eukprot:5420546-Pyramimonas_sp.AAC.2
MRVGKDLSGCRVTQWALSICSPANGEHVGAADRLDCCVADLRSGADRRNEEESNPPPQQTARTEVTHHHSRPQERKCLSQTLASASGASQPKSTHQRKTGVATEVLLAEPVSQNRHTNGRLV